MVHHVNTFPNNLSNDLSGCAGKIIDWAIQWEMGFNPDQGGEAQEVKFFENVRIKNHDLIYFNHNLVQ